MNEATKVISNLLDSYCSLEAISKITHSRYFCNAIINFNRGFQPYLINNYHIAILKYESVLKKLNKIDHSANDSELGNLCILSGSQFRFLNTKDIGIIKAVIRKYYQDSGEINLRICLLLNSKIGTKYLAKISGIDPTKISKVRHNPKLVNHFSFQDRITLENIYLNSEFAYHLNKLRVNFKI